MKRAHLATLFFVVLVFGLLTWSITHAPRRQETTSKQKRGSAATKDIRKELETWKLTLPDEEASEIQPAQLAKGYSSEYFTADSNTLMFWTPVTGGTTERSEYPRTELRETIDPTDDNINWSAAGNHQLKGQATVLETPSSGKIIISQVHAFEDRPLVKLQWENERMAALVKKFADGSNEDQKYWFKNGDAVFPAGTPFTYSITVVDGVLDVSVNKETITHNFAAKDQSWENYGFYFKAGAYPQDNEGPSTEGARVQLNKLTTSHN